MRQSGPAPSCRTSTLAWLSTRVKCESRAPSRAFPFAALGGSRANDCPQLCSVTVRDVHEDSSTVRFSRQNSVPRLLPTLLLPRSGISLSETGSSVYSGSKLLSATLGTQGGAVSLRSRASQRTSASQGRPLTSPMPSAQTTLSSSI